MILATTNFQVGDPEWIGVLQRPDQPYGPNNPFIARYAFIAVPIGNTLDLNAIHNQAICGSSRLLIRIPVNPPRRQRIFFRNQGVGSWEINLAAFLADLNTNQWDFQLRRTIRTITTNTECSKSGIAFDDARALLAYRYNNNFNNLASVDNLFSGPLGLRAINAFSNDDIDGYSDGAVADHRLSIARTWIRFNPADNPCCRGPARTTRTISSRHQELFDPNEIFAIGFTNRLLERRHECFHLRPLHVLPAALATGHGHHAGIRQDEFQLRQSGSTLRTSGNHHDRQPRRISWPGRRWHFSPTPPTGCCAPTPPNGATAIPPTSPPRSMP